MAETKPRWIQPSVSLGNLITIGVLLASVAGGWAKIESGLAAHERRIAELEESDKETRAREIDQIRLLAEMSADLRYLRAAFERYDNDRQ